LSFGSVQNGRGRGRDQQPRAPGLATHHDQLIVSALSAAHGAFAGGRSPQRRRRPLSVAISAITTRAASDDVAVAVTEAAEIPESISPNEPPGCVSLPIKHRSVPWPWVWSGVPPSKLDICEYHDTLCIMADHRLVASQFVPRPPTEVFAFFAEPANLARISPPSMRLELLTTAREMRSGLAIDYRIRPLLGVPVRWRTRITDYDPPRGFRDVQERGPYRRWEHAHRFREVEGGTRIEDDVTYALPLGRLGDAVHRLAVRGELEQIFRHRSTVIASALAALEAPPTGLTVAVAGGTGFVGGGIAAELHRRGYHVVVLTHRGAGARGGLPDAVELRVADARTGEGLGAGLRGVDAIVVALAFKNSPMESPRRHQTFNEVDAGGTEQLIAAAREAGVRRFVYISGAGAAPDAARHWFRAKWRAEEAVRASGLTWTIVRPTWVYGPRDVALNRFLGFGRRLPFVPMTNAGRQLLAPVFIDDVGRFVADALVEDAAANQVFELGGPETLPMREIIRRAMRVAGLRRPILPGPTPLLKLGAWPLQFLPEPPLTPDAVDFVNQPATVDLGPLLERMPRRLTPLEEGLATYLGPPTGTSSSLTIDGR
jgi:NADH dehydrogenase